MVSDSLSLNKGASILLLVGQPADFEERLSLLLPETRIISTRDFAHAMSFGKPDRLDVVLFEAAAAAGVSPTQLREFATPSTVWASTLRTSERPNFRELYGIEVKKLFSNPIEPENVARQISSFLGQKAIRIGLMDKKKNVKDFPSRHAELLQVFLSRSRSRLATMLAAVASGEVDSMRQVLAIDAHRLVGTLGTFGYPQATEPARTLESILSKEEPLTANDVQVIDVGARHILQILSDDSSQVLVPQSSSGPTVCLLSPDDFLRIEFSSRGPDFGFRVIAPPLSGFADALASSHQFDLAVFDFGETLPDPNGPLQTLVQQVSCKVIAVCPPLSLQQRFDLSKLALDTVAEGPLDTKSLAAIVGKRLHAPAGSRVIALDDDPVYLANLDSTLRPLNLNFQATENPEDLWTALEARKPDMVILDVGMPRYDGLQICRAIKTNPRFEDLLVLFLAGRGNPESREHASAVGGDDFIEKSVTPHELRTRIVSRLRRARASKEQNLDEVTSLPSKATATKSLENLISLAALRKLPVTLGIIKFDQPKRGKGRQRNTANEMVLQSFADLLRETFRPEDILSRWGGEEFVVGLFLTEKEELKEKLEKMLLKFNSMAFKTDEGAEFTVCFSAGISQYPLDGATLEALYESAERGISVAQIRGGSKMVCATAEKKLSEPVDVILLEEDASTAESLEKALDSKGIKSVWFQNGREARDAMLSAAPFLAGKVLLLEKGSPNLNGLGLIKELKEAGRIGATSIITLSADMTDEEVESSFELGSFDHINKPYSLPALLRNVKRGLERYRYQEH